MMSPSEVINGQCVAAPLCLDNDLHVNVLKVSDVILPVNYNFG